MQQYEYRMVQKLSVQLRTLLAPPPNGRHLGSVAEEQGALFKQEVTAEDVVAMVSYIHIHSGMVQDAATDYVRH